MSAWHGIYADVLRQRFGALVAYGVVLTGEREAGFELAQRAMETVFSHARAPHGVAQAEHAVRREMVRFVVASAAAGLDSGPDAGAGPGVSPTDGTHARAADHAEVRAWLATLTPLERAAATLYAVDGLDDRQIRRALRHRAASGRKGRDAIREDQPHSDQPGAPIPDAHAAELRALFDAESALHASPAGGATGSIAASKSVRREALVRRGVLTGTAAVAVAVVGLSAAQGIDLSGIGASPPPSASPELVTVAWNPGADRNAAVAGLTLPECGEVWIPGPQSVHGITPVVSVRDAGWDPETPAWDVQQSYDYGEVGPVPLIHVPGLVVVTLDDHVVFTRDLAEYPPLQDDVEYVALTGRDYSGDWWIEGLTMCDASEAAQEFENAYIGWEAMTEDEQLEIQKAWRDFRVKWSAFTPGTYRFYSVAPMMFGEQAALGQVILAMGIPSISYTRQNLAESALAKDPRVAAHCSTVVEDDGYEWVRCHPPDSVLRDVLTLQVDPATINEWEPGVGISEPVVVVVPAANGAGE